MEQVQGKDNYAKHRVSFELAEKVFKDLFAVEFLDDRQDFGEQRFVVIGMAKRPSSRCGLFRIQRRDQNYLGAEGDET